jgi:hemolysin D
MSAPQLSLRVGKKNDIADVINEYQQDTTEIDGERYPLLARSSLYVLVAMVLTAIIWSTIAKLDRVVSTRGRIISTEASLVVQPLETSIIKSINVKAGDIVRSGTILATLDPTFIQADYDQLRARLLSLDAQIERLEAEYANRPYSFDKVRDSELEGATYRQLQMSLSQERNAQYQSQMQSYVERIARLEANLATRDAELSLLENRLAIMREVEGMRMTLESNKTGSRLNSLAARDARLEIERNQALAKRDIAETKHELLALRADQDAFIQQWQGRTVEELVNRRNERDSIAEQLIKARKRQDLVSLSPVVDAVVLDVANRSVGSVISAAEPLFTLVPLGAPLEIEAQIDSKQLGQIKVGDAVAVKLDAYSFQEFGKLEGVVRTISEDAFNSNAANGQTSYYRTRIKLTKSMLDKEPENFRLVPGMPLVAEIKIGERTVLEYLTQPLTRGLTESMREP